MNGNRALELRDSELVVHRFIPQGECDWSGKKGEAVEISSGDAAIDHAVISIAELPRLLRFRHRQGDKQQANDATDNVAAMQ